MQKVVDRMTNSETEARKRIAIYIPDLSDEKADKVIEVAKLHALSLEMYWIDVLQLILDVFDARKSRNAESIPAVNREMRETLILANAEWLSHHEATQLSRNDGRSDDTCADGESIR